VSAGEPFAQAERAGGIMLAFPEISYYVGWKFERARRPAQLREACEK
jgi:hypothetical protein